MKGEDRKGSTEVSECGSALNWLGECVIELQSMALLVVQSARQVMRSPWQYLAAVGVIPMWR